MRVALLDADQERQGGGLSAEIELRVNVLS